MSESLHEQIDTQVKNNKVVIFMKGEKTAPMCGFSARAVEVIKTLNVPFETVNVLADEAMWDELEKYSYWPTVPQIFINGKFVGGCDIVTELHERGELKKLLG